MHLQGALLDETLTAGLAAEGTLTCVYPLVAFQRVGLVEAFTTRLAPERLFPCVYAQVALQVTLYCEAFVAVLAVIGPLSCVDHLMHFQAVSSVETLSTLLTAKWPDLSVETLVVPQELLQGETFPTDITGVRSLTCGRKHIDSSFSVIFQAKPFAGSVFKDLLLFFFIYDARNSALKLSTHLCEAACVH